MQSCHRAPPQPLSCLLTSPRAPAFWAKVVGERRSRWRGIWPKSPSGFWNRCLQLFNMSSLFHLKFHATFYSYLKQSPFISGCCEDCFYNYWQGRKEYHYYKIVCTFHSQFKKCLCMGKKYCKEFNFSDYLWILVSQEIFFF